MGRHRNIIYRYECQHKNNTPTLNTQTRMSQLQKLFVTHFNIKVLYPTAAITLKFLKYWIDVH